MRQTNSIFPASAIAVALVIADQLSKTILTGVGWPTVLNLGVAFGFLPGRGWWTMTALIVAWMAVWLIKERHRLEKEVALGFGLLLGGGVGNLIDRLAIGSVRDFVFFPFLPAFNLADFAILVGVGLVFFHEYKTRRSFQPAD
jgi:signal peptidase II